MNGSLFPFMEDVNSTAESCGLRAQHPSIIVFLCVVFLGGFLLNSFSLWVFCCRMPQWSSGNILQFHLALSDALVTPAAPLMAIYFASGSHWMFGRFFCQVKIALISMHLYGSIVFLMLISIHRYVVVVHYKKASPLKRACFVHKLCGGVWLVLLASTSSTFALFGISQVGNHTLCLSIHQHEYLKTYFTITFILLIAGVLVPFSVAVVCYASLASSISRIRSNTSKSHAIKSKSRKMVAVCLVIFGVCFMPLSLVRTVAVVVKMFYPKECQLLLHLETTYYVCWILAGANCCLDPVLYCFGSRSFTKALERSLKTVVKGQHPDTEPNSQESTTRGTYSTASLDILRSSNPNIVL